MTGRYSKVLLRKGLARHAAEHEGPATPDPKGARAREKARAEEQMLFDHLAAAPDPDPAAEKFQRLENES